MIDGSRGSFGRSRSAVAATGLLLGTLCAGIETPACAAPAGGDPTPSLFGSNGPTVLGDPAEPSVIRTRAVSADLDLLAATDPGERLRLDVFDDVSVIAEFNSTHWTNGSCLSLNGCLEGQPDSMVSFVMNDGEMTGILRSPDLGTYRMRVSNGLGSVTEIDEGALPPCASADGGDGGGGGGGGAAPPMGDPAMPDGCDSGALIDVLIMYTPQARSAAGGTAAIEAEAQLAIDASNIAYANSDIYPRLRLVHTAETSYNEGGSYFDHLNRLTYVDGYMDEAHTLRDSYGADMVALLVADTQYCGLAWVMTNPSAAFESFAFSVTTWFCAAGNLSFPHELGHNMGCCHDHDNCSGGAYTYSWGHRFFGNSGSQFRTVMSYSPGTRLQYFSNPDINYDGQPTGVASGANAADNARTIDENAPIMANFRCSMSDPDGLFVGAAGGSWHVGGNWGSGTIPGGTTEVILPVAVTITGGSAIAANVTFQDGGALTISGGGSLAAQDLNLGTTSNMFILDGSATVNSVTVESGSSVGTLDATADLTANTITIEAGGLLTGIGAVTADVTNNGDVRPGLPLGQLDIVGNYTQGATGELLAEVETLTAPDVLAVTGTATLAGDLTVVVTNGQTPTGGECFTLLTAANVTGAFGTITVPFLSIDDIMDVTASATDVEACVQALGRQGIVGDFAGDQFARAIANAGDVDQDGYDDLIVGAPHNDDNGVSAGRVYVYSGRTGTLLYTKVGSQAGDRMGWAVSTAGDVNGDGAADFLVAAPYRSNKKGQIKVYSGLDGSTLYVRNGAAASDRFGYSVGGGVDINADGYDDFLVGAPWNDTAANNAGQVRIYSGKNGGLLAKVNGEAKADLFGWSVAALGKANSDGYRDYVVGAPKNDQRATNAGKVYVYSGKTHSVLYAVKGRRAGDQFGFAVAGAGRVDSDGRDDFVVGSPNYDQGPKLNAGRIDVYSGKTGSRLWWRSGQAAGDRLGWAVAGGDDINGDGQMDIVSGAPRNGTMGVNSGRVYLRSGVNGGLIANVDADAAYDQFGYAVAGMGDLDDSGLADVAIGAPLNDTAASAAGRVYFQYAPSADGMPAPEGPPEAEGDGEPPSGEPERPDLDGDGETTVLDLNLFLDAWSDDRPEADLDQDGLVTELDMLYLLMNWR